MTCRALILGLLGVLGICGFTYFNDCVLNQSLLISDHMPVVIYGGLIVLVAVVNPVLARLRRSWVLSPAEVAVALALVLAVCCVPAFGLLRTLTASLILPHHQALKEPAWQQERLLDMVPPHLLADVSRGGDATVTTFVQGVSQGDRHMPLSGIPWYAWWRTLAYWLPLVLVLWLGLMALALVVHPQWAHHEHLPYPIARFAADLLEREGVPGSSVVRSRLFQLGCGSVFAIYAWNCLQGWCPFLAPIKTAYSFWPLAPLMDTFMVGGGGKLMTVQLRFMPIGFAFFLTSDVALALGAGPYLWCWVVGACAGYGVILESGGYLGLKTSTFVTLGAYIGFLLAILYWGRRHYVNVLRRALGLATADAVDPTSTWAARVFMLCLVAFIVLLHGSGLDWQLAVPYGLVSVAIFLVMSRITAETGLFFIQVWTFPCVALWGLLGPDALGPKAVLTLCLISCVILLDPREALMPYMINSIHLLEQQRVRLAPVVAACAVALVIGLAVAVPVTLYLQYDRGLTTIDSWTQLAAGFPFANALEVKRQLASRGTLEQAEALSGFARLQHWHPVRRCLVGFGVGLGLVLLFYAGRLRSAKWPLHPVMFLVWSTYPAWRFAPCFLLGWVIKTAVERYGGIGLHRRLVPLFTGLIAGEILGYLLGVVVGLGYYLVTGELPRYTLWR